MSQMTFWELPGAFTGAATLPSVAFADTLLNGDGGGTKFLFDLAYRGSWASGANPVGGTAVGDVSGHTAGVYNSKGAVDTYAGGGFDFTETETYPGALSGNVQGPAGCLASIKAATNQYFLVVSYMRMPAPADWPLGGTGLAQTYFAAAQAGYSSPEADLVTICPQLTTGLPRILNARRQTDGASTQAALSIDPTNYLGTVTQVAYWRNAAGIALRLKNATAGTLIATGAVGANNTGDFSNKPPTWGRTNGFNSGTNINTVNKIRLYRGWVSDLNLDTRDPATTLDADWARVAGRFS